MVIPRIQMKAVPKFLDRYADEKLTESSAVTKGYANESGFCSIFVHPCSSYASASLISVYCSLALNESNSYFLLKLGDWK